ncbi:protein FAR1-RELATED SEQUENCE 5-like [Senna tora]|uniref:Protein FAR1-RELATED SEQUENCE 5-like n=1 Tax=Senna tora TaxID=362788 RepID=A0A835CL12_9FABA|nr:protein FAR1-RELATED SEQUENCE 5-like [Senna tora]
MGFGVRKSYTNKSKKDGSIMTVRFVCNKEGLRGKDKRDHLTKNPRRETRTDCKVRMGLTHVDGIFRIYDFIEDHNHVLQTPKTTHMLASQRKISKVQALEIELAEDSGLQLRTSYELSSRHAGGKDNLGYTRLDQKNYLRTIRKRSLMYGEAGWLLRYFKKQNLKNPSYYHDYQMDSEEQITNIFWADPKMLLDYSYFGDVVSLDTTYCINNAHRSLAIFSGFNHFRGVVIFGAALLYDETASSFKWLFKTFLEANLQKKPQTIFIDQDHAMAKALHEVMPEVCHGLCTWHFMQNGIKHLGNLMKNGSHFLKDFKTCMFGYDEEAQFEVAWSRRNEIQPHFEYVINMLDQEGKFRVLFDSLQKEVFCSCRRFEHFGILCCHALKVLEVNGVMTIPDQYILKRLTKDARSGAIEDVNGNKVVEDPDSIGTMRHRQLWPKLVKLASDVSNSEQAFLLVNKVVDELCKQVSEILLETIDVNNEIDDPIAPISECLSQPTGIKKRPGTKRKGRYKSCLDRKKKSSAKNSQSQRSIDNEAVNQVNFEVPKIYGNQVNFETPQGSSNQMNFEVPPNLGTQFSFTKFLMEPFSTQSLEGSEFYGDFSNANDQS